MRCFKKRILAVCMVLCCVFGLSVESFAVSMFSYSQLSSSLQKVLEPLPGISKGYKFHVSTAKMNDTQKAEWEKVMTNYLNNSDYMVVFLLYNSGLGVIYGEKSAYSISNGVPHLRGSRFSFSLNGDFTGISADTSFTLTSSTGYYWSSDIDLLTSTDITVANCYVLDFEAFAIDDGIEREDPEPPSSSTPDQPSSSEISSIPYVPSGPPDFGTVDSEYLPYDTSIWEALMWYLRDIIGAAGKILLLIMFIVTIVPVIVSAIKHYLGDHNDHGSGIL